jgi:ATP-dependent RNA helicase RhlE
LTKCAFARLGIADPIRHALQSEGYQQPTPIQARTIPLLLEGRDVLGIAQTGTGKTAAFALPILQRLADAVPRGRGPAALILAPTRELAMQIGDAVKAYGRHLKLRTAVIFGGVGQVPQVAALRSGLDVLVATPGRLLDLIDQGHARLDQVRVLVLDEADRMLDMGFIRDVRRIIGKLPRQRQSMLFSATMPAEIASLAAEMLVHPERVEVTPAGTSVGLIDQTVFHVATAEKRTLLEQLLRDAALTRVIVFTRTKHGANRVAKQLASTGIRAEAIHGNKSQSARQAALGGFRDGRVRVLVATDIAARGIDVDAVSHIINYDLPNVAETYVHRIGRTARAGASGMALSFCDASERPFLRDIERLIRRPITVGSRPVALGEYTGGERSRAAPAGPARDRDKSGRTTRAGTDVASVKAPALQNAQTHARTDATAGAVAASTSRPAKRLLAAAEVAARNAAPDTANARSEDRPARRNRRRYRVAA